MTHAARVQPALPAEWEGVLLEHFVLHEIRSRMHDARAKVAPGSWPTPSGSEVEFVWWYGSKRVVIEVKHGTRDRPEYRKGLASLTEEVKAQSYIVYLGEREVRPCP